jgi:hypothetical protein
MPAQIGEPRVMDWTDKDFDLHEASFHLSFRQEGEFPQAELTSSDGQHGVAAELITLALKLAPAKFVTALQAGRPFSYGGFCSVSYEDGKAELSVDEQFVDVEEDVFVDLSWEVVLSLVEEVGGQSLPWWSELSAEVQAEILQGLGQSS